MALRLITFIAVVIVLVVGAVSLTDLSSQENNGKDLHLRLESFSLNLDPANILDSQSRRIIDMTHARLFRQDVEGNLWGEIAKKWQWIEPETLRVTLKPDILFSNGQEINAGDVRWSICRHIQPSSVFAWLFSNIVHTPVDDNATECSGITVNSAHELTIAVSHSPERLMNALSSSMGAIVPADSRPAEYGVITGAGPYRVAKIESNAEVKLEASRGGAVAPKMDTVIFRHIPDDAAAAAQFSAGKLDILEVGNPRLTKLTENARSNPGVRVSFVDAHQIRLLIANLERMSQKLQLTNEQAKSLLVTVGQSTVSNSLASVYDLVGKPAYSAYFPASSLLSEVTQAEDVSFEHSKGSLEVITQNDPYSEQIVALLPKQIGKVDIHYVGLDKSLLIDRMVKKEYDLASVNLEALVADPVYWASFFTPGSAFTVFGQAIPDLAEKQASKDNILEIGKLIDEQGNWFNLFQEKRMYLFSESVDGELILPTGLIDYSAIEKK